MLTGRRKMILLIFILLAASSLLYAGRDLLVFDAAYSLDSPSDAYMDRDGNLYVIDRSKMDIIKANADGTFVFVIKGGENKEDSFYNVNGLAVSEDGSLFVHGLRFEGTSLYLADERIIEYTPDGRFVRSLFSITYDHTGPEPRQEGLIRGLSYEDGLLRFAYCGEDAISVYELPAGGEASLTFTVPAKDAWKTVQDVCVAPDGTRVFYTNKPGELWEAAPSGAKRLDTKPSVRGTLETTPYRLAFAAPDTLLFSDLGMWSIRGINPETGHLKTVFGTEEGAPVPDNEIREILYSISVNANNVITVGDAVYVAGLDGGDTRAFDSFPFAASRIVLIIALWILGALAAVIGFYLLAKTGRLILSCSSVVKLAAVVVALTIVISFFISALVISGMNSNIEKRTSQTILYMASLGASLTDGDALSRIGSNKDYQNEDYTAIKSVLDNLQLRSDIYELDLYYLLFKNKGDIALGVMDSENLVSPAYPYGITPEFYNQAALEGKTVYGQVGDTTGMWGFALSPVLDGEGAIAGVLEIGIDMNSHMQFLRGQVVDVVLNVFAITVVFILLTIEIATFIPYFNAREKGGTAALSENAPYILRVLTFLLFTACSLQDSFIPVLAMNAYTPVLGIPHSVGGALPITLEMLAIAGFAVATGGLSSRLNRKSLTILGPSLVAAGFAVIAVNSGYWFLIAGKLLCGSGLGMSVTMINGAAAALPEQTRGKAFDGISFGMISGMQVGIVVGSLIVGFAGYGTVFFLSSAVALLVVLLSVGMLHPAKAETIPSGDKKPGLFRFLFSARTGGFLFLILAPALTVATLIEYYIPIFSADSGLSEANVGQISLIYGIFIILIGPAVSPRLLKRIGAPKSVALAMLVAALGIAAFAIWPGIPMMLIMVFLYGVSQSFGITARFSGFAALREVKAFGSDRAMGVYGMFESLAQSVAPIFIASAFVYGYSAGAAMIILFLTGAFAVYMVINRGRHKV